jgi:3-oxoacyl-[acyl-carrier protein] reductase
MLEQVGLSNGSVHDLTERPVVLITGASAGIGEAIARRFAAAGYRIVAVARRQEKLDALSESLSGQTQVACLSLDVAEPASAARAVRFALETFGRLDCLVNNAGSGRWAPVHQTDDAAMDEVIDISLKATFRFCREAVPVLKPGSAIVTVGSTFGLIGGVDGGIYCAVKAALVGLTQTMAAQYGPQGIRSNLVAPGVIKTDMTKDYWDARGFQRLNHEMTPFDREGTPEDVANAVYFLASPEGSYINGQSIALDGGWTTTKFLVTDALVSDRVPPQAAGAAVNG